MFKKYITGPKSKEEYYCKILSVTHSSHRTYKLDDIKAAAKYSFDSETDLFFLLRY